MWSHLKLQHSFPRPPSPELARGTTLACAHKPEYLIYFLLHWFEDTISLHLYETRYRAEKLTGDKTLALCIFLDILNDKGKELKTFKCINKITI